MIDCFSPCASTAKVVTSASPIISAAAVEAVRAGLRIAFRRASVPAAPPILVAGQPITSASGRVMLGATIAMPTKTVSTPMPSRSRRGPVGRPETKAPTQTRASAPAQTSSATAGPKRASREGASTDPSRTAAIGGTRVACSAGQRLATSVTPVPTESETMTVRVAKISPARGSFKPSALKSASSPLASPSPTKSPTTEARNPITSPSSTTVQRTWREVAPSVRNVPNSRVRWATVIESVLAITNAPTKSAMPPKASRKYRSVVIAES